MISAPIPNDERERLARLAAYGILDTPPEERFDRITRLLSELLDAPISLISLVDESRQWFKSSVGLDASETPRGIAFCAHAILDEAPLIVSDAFVDERFRENPLVTNDPRIRFYAGAPLISADGFRLGTLCAIDRKPRTLSEQQIRILRTLSAVVIDEMELTASNDALQKQTRLLEEQNRCLDGFSRALTHDLAGPMRRVTAFAEMLEDDSDVPVEQSIAFIKAAAEQAGNLITQLQAYFKLGRTATPEPTSSRACLDTALQSLASDLEASDASVEIGALPDFEYYPALLTTLFENVIDNSIKYRSAERGLEIRVTSQDLGESWKIAVDDNGIGIEDHERERAFELLTRLGASSTTAGPGVGLAICRRIIECGGGEIRIESSALGSGTRLAFELPKAPQASSEAS